MDRKITLELFLRYCGQKKSSDLEQVFTHKSFSEEKNNSREVFKGTYYFKGQVADWCFSNIRGTGTQLQHFLGNITGKQAMDDFFDYLQLEKHCRIGKGIKLDEQKHIFAYGLLGWISGVLDAATLKRVIYRFFIAPNDHLLPQTYFIVDPWQQLLFLSRQQGITKPKRKVEKNTDGLYECEIKLGNGELVRHISASYIYVQKKTIRLALKKMAGKLADGLEQDQRHQALMQLNELQKKAEKEKDRQGRIAAWEKKQQEKKIQKTIKKNLEETRNRLKNQQRILSKQLAKEKAKKKKQTIYKEYTEEEINSMSASKRRNLQDRGIIPGGK